MRKTSNAIGAPGEGLENPGYSPLFILVVCVFVTCLITANITAVKLVDLFGFILPAAIFIFPLSYIVGDVLTARYSRRAPFDEIEDSELELTGALEGMRR